MYYSVLIEVPENIGSKKVVRPITLIDQPNIDRIKKEIIVPYINEEEFFVDGYCLTKTKISRIKIVSSEQSIAELVDIEYEKIRKSNVLCIINDAKIISNSKVVRACSHY